MDDELVKFAKAYQEYMRLLIPAFELEGAIGRAIKEVAERKGKMMDDIYISGDFITPKPGEKGRAKCQYCGRYSETNKPCEHCGAPIIVK